MAWRRASDYAAQVDRIRAADFVRVSAWRGWGVASRTTGSKGRYILA
jgi:hypothetical protein